ncbi:hypothetical protein RRG08_009534 [Elysia crispata]|uniref:Uncharacterized protein n=1 Tax=Elysia crispata TaxID=231223 RepID=A0AAE1E8V0_9GAST|nr:hypothetical protein RRG08_009534 [Elysia crispata]
MPMTLNKRTSTPDRQCQVLTLLASRTLAFPAAVPGSRSQHLAITTSHTMCLELAMLVPAWATESSCLMPCTSTDLVNDGNFDKHGEEDGLWLVNIVSTT